MRVLPQVSEVTSLQNVNSSNNVTGGNDYTAGPYTVTFSAGETSASFSIPITDDNTFEATETFSLSFDPSSLPGRVTSDATLTATIMDDDSKLTDDNAVIV